MEYDYWWFGGSECKGMEFDFVGYDFWYLLMNFIRFFIERLMIVFSFFCESYLMKLMELPKCSWIRSVSAMNLMFFSFRSLVNEVCILILIFLIYFLLMVRWISSVMILRVSCVIFYLFRWWCSCYVCACGSVVRFLW